MGAAAWFADRLHPFAQDVGSVVPPGYAAYARVFHPAHGNGNTPVRWRDIAKANGRRVHAEMQFGNIAGTWWAPSPHPDLWVGPPYPGNLPLTLAHALVEILRPHTVTPERCWFAMWEGWGDIAAPAGAEWLRTPQRDWFILEGVLERALRPIEPDLGDRYQSPSMWWPDDHAWFVSTEVDFAWTYVGGSREAITAVLSHPALEAHTATVHDRFTWDADLLNPSPGPPHARVRR